MSIPRTNVLLRSEETDGHVSVTEIELPPHTVGPPLHTHDFDEAFYVLEGELIFQVADALATKRAGETQFRPAQRCPRARQSQRRGRALRARLHARRLRAPLGTRRRRGGRGRAAAVGAAADPGDHGRRDKCAESLLVIAREWTRIGVTGFGGPPAHIALLRRLCVDRRRWMDAHEFEDAIAACDLLPGPASTQLAIFCAYRVGGPAGRDRRRARVHRARRHPRPGAVGAVPRAGSAVLGARRGRAARAPRWPPSRWRPGSLLRPSCERAVPTAAGGRAGSSTSRRRPRAPR